MKTGLIAFGVGLASLGTLWGSDYPPGYEIFRECQTLRPMPWKIEICAINRLGGAFPRIEIRYETVSSEFRPHRAWVRLNAHSDFFPLANKELPEVWEGSLVLKSFIVIGAPRDLNRCYLSESGEPPYPGYLPCTRTYSGPPGSIIWEYTPPSATELKLVEAARRDLWEVEVAFQGTSGWDSRFGQNFMVQFGSDR
jgi:hypothetical protein